MEKIASWEDDEDSRAASHQLSVMRCDEGGLKRGIRVLNQ